MAAPAAARGTQQPRPVLAYAFAEPPVDLTLAAERRKPQVTVRQLMVARIEDGVVKYQFTLFYNVLYSGIKSLRIDVPHGGGRRAARDDARRARSGHFPTAEGPATGDVAWSLSRRDGVSRRRQDRVDVGEEDRRSSTWASPWSCRCPT